MKTDQRPCLTPSISLQDFLDYYWLKHELLDFSRQHTLPTSGSKQDLTARIAQWLLTGHAPLEASPARVRPRPVSDQLLELTAPITAQYTSSEAVRAFFRAVIGPHFRFTVGLMKFCQQNPTGTFGDAVSYWQVEHQRKGDKTYRSPIGPQFEYNQYIRDFKADNPGSSLQEAIACWQLKRRKASDNRYCRADLPAKPDGYL